jgi:NAD(P)-dependent dehydrogenase (short-subunit alcohol dehydrogenase family)
MIAFDFDGTVVAVTGAGSGIGLTIAQAFHAAGAQVAVGDLDGERAAWAASALGGVRVFCGDLDVRNPSSVAAFFTAAERALGPVTVTVANAGVFPNCPVLDLPVEEWDRVIESARHVPDVPGSGPADGGRRTERQNHHDGLRRACERAAGRRALLRL